MNDRPFFSLKSVAFRLGAVGLGLLGVLVLEGVFRLIGLGRPELAQDAYVDFQGIRPLFERSADGTLFRTATVRTNFFVRDQFSVTKQEREFRVFVLGGSTVQGRPYAIETAFPQWMELSLQARSEARYWRVVNCGGISYASYRLVPILQECLERYQPDLIVLCTGQNEFLEARTYGAGAGVRTARGRLQLLLSRSHVFQWFRGAPSQTSSASGSRAILKTEVDALLDYRGGLDSYDWDPAWKTGVELHFEHNLERMASLCRTAGVPMMVVAPPVNLRSCPPFKSVSGADLTDAERAEWENCLNEARKRYRDGMPQVLPWLQRAVELDPQYAQTYYDLGMVLENLGRRQEARAAFVRAKELDVCPLRLLESGRDALAALAKRHGLPYLDCQALLEGESDYDSLGGEWLIDHVHPTIQGHQRIAKAIVELMEVKGWVETRQPDWQARETLWYSVQMDTLGSAYYVHGQQRLKNLQLWTQGRTDAGPFSERANRPSGTESEP